MEKTTQKQQLIIYITFWGPLSAAAFFLRLIDLCFKSINGSGKFVCHHGGTSNCLSCETTCASIVLILSATLYQTVLASAYHNIFC